MEIENLHTKQLIFEMLLVEMPPPQPLAGVVFIPNVSLKPDCGLCYRPIAIHSGNHCKVKPALFTTGEDYL